MREGPLSLQGGVQRQKFPRWLPHAGFWHQMEKIKREILERCTMDQAVPSLSVNWPPGRSQAITSVLQSPSWSPCPRPQASLPSNSPSHWCQPFLLLALTQVWFLWESYSDQFPAATFSQPPLGKFHHQFFILLRRQLNPRGENCSLFKISQEEPAQASLSSKQSKFLFIFKS